MVSEERKKRKSDRITLHSKELYRNLHEWVELKIQLTVSEFRDSIWDQRKKIVLAIIVCFSILLSVVFLLIATAIWLGNILNNLIWGFLITALLMSVASWLIYHLALKTPNIDIDQPNQLTSETHGQPRSKV